MKTLFLHGAKSTEKPGLSYDSNRQSLRLKAAVVIFVEPVKPDEAHRIQSDQADYEKPQSADPSFKGDRETRPNSLHADLVRPSCDRRIHHQQIEASGHVNATSLDPKCYCNPSDHASYVFDTTGRWLENLLAGDGMIRSLTDLNRLLTSDRSEIAFNSKTNIIHTVQAKECWSSHSGYNAGHADTPLCMRPRLANGVLTAVAGR
jgi:hypothetical protein